MDRYAYVNNSPVNFTDPSGHCSTDGDDWCNNSTSAPVPTSTQTPTSTPTSVPTQTPLPTPLPTPTGSPNSKETAIDYLQYSPLGQDLYNRAMAEGLTISYNSSEGGGLDGKTILISPSYSATYNAGTIAHETTHYIYILAGQKEGSKYQEYVAMLVGDVVRSQIIQSGHGTSADMRNPISNYTVDLSNPNNIQITNDLNRWINNYENSYNNLPTLPVVHLFRPH